MVAVGDRLPLQSDAELVVEEAHAGLHAKQTNEVLGRGEIEVGVVVVRREPFTVAPRPRSHRRRRCVCDKGDGLEGLEGAQRPFPRSDLLL